MSPCIVIPESPPLPRVVLARRARGLSRGDVARLTGIHAARLREIDRGRQPTVEELDRLVRALDFPHAFFRRMAPPPSIGPAFVCFSAE